MEQQNTFKRSWCPDTKLSEVIPHILVKLAEDLVAGWLSQCLTCILSSFPGLEFKDLAPVNHARIVSVTDNGLARGFRVLWSSFHLT